MTLDIINLISITEAQLENLTIIGFCILTTLPGRLHQPMISYLLALDGRSMMATGDAATVPVFFTATSVGVGRRHSLSKSIEISVF